jgi:peptidoglycan hydrolase-like protein with peptidoglycan-binding domain
MNQNNFYKQTVLLPEFETMFSEMFFEYETTPVSRTSKAYIKWVQESLNSIMGLTLSTDGDLGTKTRSAIRSFQQNKAGFKGANIDGKVGPATEAALIKAGATSPPGTHIVVAPPTSHCTDAADITAAFRKFLADAPVIVMKSRKIATSIKPEIIAMLNAITAVENGVDINKLNVTTCTKIINPLLAGSGGSALAEIHMPTNTMRLTSEVFQYATDFVATEGLDKLSNFFKTIAHEKRHATLGATVLVSPAAAYNKSSAISDAAKAQYRTEEILANAEEIAVGKRLLPGYTVNEPTQQLIRKHWVIVEGMVNTTEVARLRNLIIQQLRNRYGFANKCDTAMTVGILMCMERGEWHACFDGGNIYRPIPAGLNACKTNDKFNICFEY